MEQSGSFIKKVFKGIGSGIQSSFINLKGTEKQLMNQFGKSLNCSRIRNPSIFYGTERRLKDYRKVASFAMFAVNQLLHEADFELTLLDVFKLTNEKNKSAQEILVVSLEWILCVDPFQYSIIWKSKSSAILQVAAEQSRVDLQFSSVVKINDAQTDKISFTVRNPKVAQKIVQRVQNVMFCF